MSRTSRPLLTLTEVKKGGNYIGDWQRAYHGTALRNVVPIMESGLVTGPSATDGNFGVYCERRERAANTMNYMAHRTFSEVAHKLTCFAACFELMVERWSGGTVHRQWYQREEDSVVITGVYIHAVNFLRTLDRNYRGWYRILDDSLSELEGKKIVL